MPLTLDRCSVCRASLERTEESDIPCRRCGAELGTVRAALEQAKRAASDSRRALERGDLRLAVELAMFAVATADEPETRAALQEVQCAKSASG